MDRENYQKMWQYASKVTKIVRPRVSPLSLHDTTELPYIFLSSSEINQGNTLVRRGKVEVKKPILLLPKSSPLFSGDDFDSWMKPELLDMLLVRGVSFPSVEYKNAKATIDIYEGELPEAKKYFFNQLQGQEELLTGLVLGNDDCWQLSIMIYTLTIMNRTAKQDIAKIISDIFGSDIE